MKLDNSLTRWSSAYMMLVSVKKAMESNIYSEIQNQPNIQLQTVEIYIQILQPAHELSIGFQSNTSTIGEIIPALNRDFFTWSLYF